MVHLMPVRTRPRPKDARQSGRALHMDTYGSVLGKAEARPELAEQRPIRIWCLALQRTDCRPLRPYKSQNVLDRVPDWPCRIDLVVSGLPQQWFDCCDKFGDFPALVGGVAVTLCRPRS